MGHETSAAQFHSESDHIFLLISELYKGQCAIRFRYINSLTNYLCSQIMAPLPERSTTQQGAKENLASTVQSTEFMSQSRFFFY